MTGTHQTSGGGSGETAVTLLLAGIGALLLLVAGIGAYVLLLRPGSDSIGPTAIDAGADQTPAGPAATEEAPETGSADATGPADLDTSTTVTLDPADDEVTTQPARCRGPSAFGVSYQLPATVEWLQIDSPWEEPGVYFSAQPIGFSSIDFRLLPGHQLDTLVREHGVDPADVVEVEVPGATRAVRYLTPPSETGDGVAEVQLMEAGQVTIEASTYTYIEDIDRFTPMDLAAFLDSLCVDASALPATPAAPDGETLLAGHQAVACGLVRSAFDTEVLVVRPQIGIDCVQATAVVHRYLNDDGLDRQGSGGFASFDGWACSSTSGAASFGTGRAGSCGSDDGGHTIVMCSPGSSPGSDGFEPDELCVAALG